MTAVDGLIALMHLSGVIGVLAAAYVGFDRGHERSDQDASAYKAAQGYAAEIIQTLDIKTETKDVMASSKKWSKKRIIYPLCVICVIARKPIGLKWQHKVGVFVYRQRHIPAFKYFYYKIDLWVTAIISVCSILIFLKLGAILVWRDVSYLNDSTLQTIFKILCTFIIFIIVQGVLKFLQSETWLVRKCTKLNVCIKDRLQTLFEEARDTLSEFHDGGPGGAQAS